MLVKHRFFDLFLFQSSVFRHCCLKGLILRLANKKLMVLSLPGNLRQSEAMLVAMEAADFTNAKLEELPHICSSPKEGPVKALGSTMVIRPDVWRCTKPSLRFVNVAVTPLEQIRNATLTAIQPISVYSQG